MGDTLTSLFYRISGDLPAVAIELVLIALCVNWSASVLHSTRGTRPLRGVLVMLVVATVIVRLFGWERLELLYSYVLAGLAFIALVVFQPELRRALIRVGDVGFQRRRGPTSQLISALVKSAGYLSRNRYGALIAIQREVDLTGWAENGTVINAEVSSNLLNSIFFPNSPLHDLGVIIRGTRVLAANCQFPSPESDEVESALGSRHLAAVGMSYECDALVLVVSEETGVISLADNGKLTRYLTLDDLSDELEGRLLRKRSSEGGGAKKKSAFSTFWKRIRRALLVVPLTIIIWYLIDQATLVDSKVDVELLIRGDDPAFIVDILEPQVHIVDPQDPRTLLFAARFRGSARAIDELSTETAAQPLTLAWDLPPRFARATEEFVLDADEIPAIIESLPPIRNRGLNVTEIVLEDSVRLRVDRLVTLRVPVRVTGEAVPVEVQNVQPPTVEARIRSQDTAALPPEDERAVRAVLGEERLRSLAAGEVRTFERVGLVPRIGPVRIARMKPDQVTISVQVAVGDYAVVRNVIVQLFSSPEVARNYLIERIDPNEWRIDVDVAGKQEVIQGLGPADLSAYAHVSDELVPASGEDPLRLLNVVVLPPEGVRIIQDRPRTVRVRIVPRAESGP
jgi:diadenylate cyclase